MSRSHTPLFLVVLALAVALGAAVLAACGGAGVGADASPSSPPDPVVLLVDGQAIHRSAVDAVRAEFRLGGTSDTEARAEKEAVRRELLRREAQRLGLKPDAAEVATRSAAMAKKAGGRDALTVALQRVSMTEAQLQSGIEYSVLHDALQDAKFGGLKAGRQQARAYYDAHRAAFRHVASVHLWSIQVSAERIAESALVRLRSGRPFEEVARQFSNDLEAKAKGGDLGRVEMASLPVPFRKMIAATRPGHVSKPVAGPGGWFLLLAKGVRPDSTTPFAKAEPPLVRELTRRERFAALDAWLKAAGDKATVARP